MTKPLFIGQAPGRVPGEALAGRCGRFMASMAGMDFDEFREAATFVNVLKRWPGKSGKGDRFPMEKARTAAAEMVLPPGLVVFVGKKVAEAFGAKKLDYLEWKFWGHNLVAVLPHPSGINRYYNNPENRKRVKSFLRNLLRK